jgi:hypothetical protein
MSEVFKKDGGVAMRDKKMAMIHFWEKQIPVIVMWRQSGASVEQVAALMRISVNTLIAWAKDSELIREALYFGKWQALATANASLMNQVKKGNMSAIKYYNQHNRRGLYDLKATGLSDNALTEDTTIYEMLEQVDGYELDV